MSEREVVMFKELSTSDVDEAIMGLHLLALGTLVFNSNQLFMLARVGRRLLTATAQGKG